MEGPNISILLMENLQLFKKIITLKMNKEIINLEYSRFNKLPFEGKFEFLNKEGEVVKNK